jgi:hypothetical protein
VKVIRILLIAALVLAPLGLMGTALAQEGGSAEQPPGDQTLPSNFPNPQDIGPSGISPEDVGNQTTGAGAGALPFTGAQITLFALAGVVAIGTGAALVRRARSSDTT